MSIINDALKKTQDDFEDKDDKEPVQKSIDAVDNKIIEDIKNSSQITESPPQSTGYRQDTSAPKVIDQQQNNRVPFPKLTRAQFNKKFNITGILIISFIFLSWAAFYFLFSYPQEKQPTSPPPLTS